MASNFLAKPRYRSVNTIPLRVSSQYRFLVICYFQLSIPCQTWHDNRHVMPWKWKKIMISL